MARSDSAVVLSTEGVTVSFGGLQALTDVTVEVRKSEIVGLVGPNGAGKSTLMECISGFQPYSGGRIEYLGEDLSNKPAHDRAWMGIGRTLQNVSLFQHLSVVDNVRVALHRHMKRGTVEHAFRLPAANREEREILDRANELVDLIGMESFADKQASELSYGTLRLLELACMLALDPDLLLLDEPASGISQKETEALGPLLRRIRARTNSTILMIEHDMPLIMGLADWMYVLDAGQVISTGTPDTIRNDPRVIEAYLGSGASQGMKSNVAGAAAIGERSSPMLEVCGIDVHYGKVRVLHDVDFEVHPGEKVALLGTNGAGKSTVLKAASGLVTPTAGKVLWKGQPIDDVPAAQRVKLGLGQVPGGRGVFPTLTVDENLRMGGYLLDDDDDLDRRVKSVEEYFPWISERREQLAGTLSGGEQQQLAIGRALIGEPELLMIDELSLGLAPIIIGRLMETIDRLHSERGITFVIVEQQASFALAHTTRAYFLEKGTVRYEGPSSGLTDRADLLRSVFLAGAVSGFDGKKAGS